MENSRGDWQRGCRTAERTVGYLTGCRAVSARPFTQCDVGESVGILLALVDVPEDYQRQRLLDLVVAVHPVREGVTDPFEGSGHDSDGLRTVGAVNSDEMQHHARPWSSPNVKLRHMGEARCS